MANSCREGLRERIISRAPCRCWALLWTDRNWYRASCEYLGASWIRASWTRASCVMEQPFWMSPLPVGCWNSKFGIGGLLSVVVDASGGCSDDEINICSRRWIINRRTDRTLEGAVKRPGLEPLVPGAKHWDKWPVCRFQIIASERFEQCSEQFRNGHGVFTRLGGDIMAVEMWYGYNAKCEWRPGEFSKSCSVYIISWEQ
jgi:hypothetical protein